MRVTIFHHAVALRSRADDADVLVEAEAIGQALSRLGHSSTTVSCTLDLASAARRLRRARPDVVFNLVESLGGTDGLQHVAPALLDSFGLAYTGSPTAAIFLSGEKLLAKERLVLCGLPTPAWLDLREDSRDEAPPSNASGEHPSPAKERHATPAGKFIVKAIAEHASLGIDDDVVVEVADADALRARVRTLTERLGRPCFAERYVDGREIVVSILEGASGPIVLPPAEIDFSSFPPEKPRIVGYRAKWDPESFEWSATPRRFRFPASDRPLLGKLSQLAVRAWRAFGLRGYGRVDFRVDREGKPWILEINANPCLSPDAGFAAALAEAGIGYDAAVDRLLAVAMRSLSSHLLRR